MMRNKSITVAVALLLSMTASSFAWAATGRPVTLGGFLLLRIRTPAGGYTAAERAAALQLRANELLKGGKPSINVRIDRSGNDHNIYTDDKLFITVTQADARANGTTAEGLASLWAERLLALYPRATPEKPGVGPALHPSEPSEPPSD